MSFFVGHLGRTYEKAAEAAYKSGREQFANDRIERAIAEWEHALFVMPSLRVFSDIDYWRGRAFEAAVKPQEAAVAYRTFLEYSEHSLPTYFKESFSQDPAWEVKAQDAERRLLRLAGR